MSGQCTHRLGVILPHGASIPHFADSIVTPGEQDLGAYVSKGYCIHIILMGLNLGRKRAGYLGLLSGSSNSQGPGSRDSKSQQQYLKGAPVLFSIKDIQAAVIGPEREGIKRVLETGLRGLMLCVLWRVPAVKFCERANPCLFLYRR